MDRLVWASAAGTRSPALVLRRATLFPQLAALNIRLAARHLPTVLPQHLPLLSSRAASSSSSSSSSSSAAAAVPNIATSSFWKSMIPKPLRGSRSSRNRGRGGGKARSSSAAADKPSEWNPATFFIVIFLFIGSMSIQMIALRKDHEQFVLRAKGRASLLQEVIQKLRRGEDVDVEKALGSGDAEQELKWEEMLRQLEREDLLMSPTSPKDGASRGGSNDTGVAAEKKPPKVSADASASHETGKEEPAKTTGYSSFF